MQELAVVLASILADPARVSWGDSDLDVHSRDLTFHRSRRPDLVVYPVTTDEVSKVLAVADERRVPVTPFGAGSSLEGHVIPLAGGISLDLSRMDRVLSVRPADLVAVVQPGVLRSTLGAVAGEHGLMFPVDPGADATLGGMAATNAAGTTTVRYGKMRPNVLAVEAVLPGGRIVRTGSRARKTSAGYDLTGLLVGSEGTLAVITELTLQLHGIPEHAVTLRIAFPDVEAACRAAAALVGAGAGVSRLELVDGWTMAALNAYRGGDELDDAALFVEAEGSESSVEGDLELVCEIAGAEGALDIVWERSAEARARLWHARHQAAYAVSASAPGKGHRATDVCVPVSELAAAAVLARAELDRLGLHGGILGHAGDGNLHVSIMVDPDDADEVRRSDELVATLVEDALARGGTCTGEHGVGAGKIDWLRREHGDLVPLYRGIKALFDPHGIMNPGKVLAATAG